ncbi:sigma-54-dependent Fis family transcriptional regulator [Thiospirochaeta perfilievii]|uniref:Sigma-54-dependent Fis family transcriptional regulator n=1 Tax=Thiospirochaeta perfilievii TaxID=252967 RepID=A0A5C1QCH6_9SPIO|nr:sigma-54 dependent transcriptional regulator [Thiospirochaeta perfilievii]QEN04810.1 sigma-54-dependent Fis family transcriptional regulator [Thiospirochaeta perfilievii]
MNKNILIIDDEEPIRNILSSILEDEGYTTYTAASAEDGISVLERNHIALVFLDLWLPGMDGLELLKLLQKEINTPEIIVISGHANVDIAVQAIKIGAFDCIEKPLDLNRILSLTSSAITQFNTLHKNNIGVPTSVNKSQLIGECDKILEIKKLIDQISTSDSRVMILGENGTGKEVVAREIYLNSNRKDKPFVEVNCAAIPENLIESELFGHEKGAFTGAIDTRIGKFEAAHGGTLFLDEIADMSSSAQAKVLRAIQEQKFHRVGSDKLIDVDIRIISATNKNIHTEIKKGSFREDLFFRLNVIPINVPPLKDRGADIGLLANYFLQRYNKDNSCNKSIISSSMNLLEKHSWPGNVRELKNFIEKICIICNDDSIDLHDFIDFELDNDDESIYIESFMNLSLIEAKDEFEKKIIYSKLIEMNGNITKTADALGIYPSNLHNKIKKHGIIIEK